MRVWPLCSRCRNWNESRCSGPAPAARGRGSGELKNLKVIKLDYTSVDDKGLESLKALPQLQELSLDATGVTDKGARRCNP